MDAQLRELITSKQVDFGQQSDDYAKHRPGFPDSFYERVRALLDQRGIVAPADGQTLRVLDVGCGPGVVGLRLVEVFDGGVEVVGIDISKEQVAAAQQRAAAMELKPGSSVRFHQATAEDTLIDESDCFDLIICGQCWPWFEHDKAMPELKRLLKPDGQGLLVVAQFCYQSMRSPIARRTEELILEINPAWTMAFANGLYPSQVDQLVVDGGFELQEQFAFDHPQPFTHESWRGRIRTCNGVGASGVLTEEQKKEFDQRLAQMLEEEFPADKDGRITVSHRVWAVVVYRE